MSYRLFKVVNKLLHYAEIELDISPSETNLVVLSGKEFLWLKNEYGPNAWEWNCCVDYRHSCMAGCNLALNEISPMKFIVIVNEIKVSPCDSSFNDVKHASCLAVYDYLKIESRNLPGLI